MTIRKCVSAGLVVACTLGTSLAIADEAASKAQKPAVGAAHDAKAPAKEQKKADVAAADRKADLAAAEKSADGAAAKPDTVGTPSRGTPSGDRVTDSTQQVPTQTTTVAGAKAVNKDEDLDMSVGKTQTTAADPSRRDVVESRAERRREGEGRRVTVAPLVGYGFNDLGVGVGARAGYTFDSPIYVGGTFMYHAGRDNIVDRPGVTESSSTFLYPGVEVGYDIGIGPVLLRPYVGSGILFGRMKTVTNGASSTDTEKALMFYPGASANYIIRNTPVFVGADTRVLLPLENQGPSLNLLGTAGLYL